MRLKIFVFPLAIIVALILFFFWIRPEYADMRTNQEALKEAEEKLANAEQRKQTVETLSVNLSQNQQNEALVLGFLPQSSHEEYALNALGQMANASGVALVELGVASERKDSTTKPVVQAVALDSQEEEKNDELSEQYVGIEVVTVGRYENLRAFLDRIVGFERKNIVESIVVEADDGAQDQQNQVLQPSEVLKMSVTVQFAFAPKDTLRATDISPVFQKTSFDYSAATAHAEATRQNVPQISVDASGTSNPFLP